RESRRRFRPVRRHIVLNEDHMSGEPHFDHVGAQVALTAHSIWADSEVLDGAETGNSIALYGMFLVCWFFAAGCRPIDVHDAKLLALYQARFPERRLSKRRWLQMLPYVAQLFVQVRPNLWAPSPAYFTRNNPALENQRHG